MDVTTLSIIISILALVISILSFFLNKKDKIEIKPEKDGTYVPLQLQAYERLVLLCERIAIPNLISRMSQPHFSAKEMQLLLIDNIKQEFEYNSSQQIYVSSVAWEAVRNLRDQSMLIINQVANILPQDAKASDLNKQLLEVIMNQKEAALHTIVLNALNFEAKKLIQ